MTQFPLNVSQLRNLRNWPRADLPMKTQVLVVPVSKPVTVAASEEIVGELMRAHEALRSRLADDAAGRPVQHVLPASDVNAGDCLDLVELAEGADPLADPNVWAKIPVPPEQGCLRGIVYFRHGKVVAVKLSLSHVFVDALGKQATARHLRQLLEGKPRPGGRQPKQAGVFAKGPDDAEVKNSTEHWKTLLSDIPRSCTYSGVRRERYESAQVAQVLLTHETAESVDRACAKLGVSPHAVWAAALSVVVSRMAHCHRQVFKATYANRTLPADLGAVAQVAQPVFPLITGEERDTLRSRTDKTVKALESACGHSMYDANALLDWLNSAGNLQGAVFEPAFEVNYVPTMDRDEAHALYGPAADGVRFEKTYIDPRSAKSEIALTVRHLPRPLAILTARRPVCDERDTRRVVDDCLHVIRAMGETPDAAVAAFPIAPLPSTARLLRGHRSGVAIDVEMTRSLVESAPGVASCAIEPVDGPGGTLRVRARVRMRHARKTPPLAWIRHQQPWYAGSIVPDELIT